MLLVQLLKTWSYITASWKGVNDSKTFFFPWKMWPELRSDLLLVITRKTWNISHYSFLLISRKMIPLSLNTFLEWRVNFCIAVLDSWGVKYVLVNYQQPGDVSAIACPERPWAGEVSSGATWRSFWVWIPCGVFLCQGSVENSPILQGSFSPMGDNSHQLRGILPAVISWGIAGHVSAMVHG